MADYLNIAGRIRTTASDGVAMEAQEVKDLNLNKSQQEINADVQTELGDRYTKEETYNREELNELITTPDVNRVYVIATNLTTSVTDLLPATGSSDTLYNVGNWNGTQYDTTVYSIYGWDGTAYVCLAVRSSIGEVYDISANHPDGQGNPTPYADLTAALGTDGANVPAGIRRGGMSIKFIQGTVQSSDNKYIQARCMAQNFTTDVTQWQGVDDEPTADSQNLPESGGVYNIIRQLNAKSNSMYDGYYLDYNHVFDSTNLKYLKSKLFDTAWVCILEGTSKLTVKNATVSAFRFFSSLDTPNSETNVGTNTDGIVPTGAKLVLIAFSHTSNPSGYSNLEIEQENDLIHVIDEYFPKGLYFHPNHLIGDTSQGTRTYQRDTGWDCFHVIIRGQYRINIDGLLEGARYWFYNDMNIFDGQPVSSKFISYSTTGIVPEGAVICVVNVQKSLYQSGYGNFRLEQYWPTQPYVYTEIYANVRDYDMLVNKGFYIDNNHVLSIDTDVNQYVESSNFDCIIIYVRGSNKIKINGLLDTANYRFFDIPNIFGGDNVYSHRLAINKTGIVPDGAVICVVNLTKTDYPNGYDDFNLEQYWPNDEENIQEKLRQSDMALNKDFYFDYNHLMEETGGNPSIVHYISVDTYNCVIIALHGETRIKLNGLHSGGYYRFYDTIDIFNGEDVKSHRIGANMEGIVPDNAVVCIINLQKSSYTDDEYDSFFLTREYGGALKKNLKVVYTDTNTFYVRGKIDDTHDAIITFSPFVSYNFNQNVSIVPSRFYLGLSSETDNEILSSHIVEQDCNDMPMPLVLTSVGAIFAQHGLSIPMVTISNHGLDDSYLGTEWVDQNDWHYTIGKISGNNIYLLPVIYNKENPGHEYREWHDFHSEYPTQISRNGVTLTVSSHARYDIQIAQLENVKVVVDGAEINTPGTWYCKELTLSYRQIGYNPFSMDEFFPPVYQDVMAYFDRMFTLSGDKGFMSMTMNTTLNIQRNVEVASINAVGIIEPVNVSGCDVHVCIPKAVKTGFTSEFIANSSSSSTVRLYKNLSDVADLTNLPDRVYSYVTQGNDILYGCAGGVSLVRGKSVPSVRSGNIDNDETVTMWSPPATNKCYFYINSSEFLDPSFIAEWETYVCWYKPVEGVQTWYYKSGNDYILYIHTTSAFSKKAINVSSILNGLSVKEVIERKGTITNLTSIITDETIYINSGSGYEYLVLRIG